MDDTRENRRAAGDEPTAEPQPQPSPERRQADRNWDQALRLLRGEQAQAAEPEPEPELERREDETIQLTEERLRPRKEIHESNVQVRKEVETELRTFQVPVKRERVKVERQPAHRPPDERPPNAETAAGQAGAPQEPITLPLREEEVEVVVHKRPVVNAEVSVDTRPVESTEQVSDTVRREEARLTQHGAVQVHESGPADRASP